MALVAASGLMASAAAWGCPKPDDAPPPPLENAWVDLRRIDIQGMNVDDPDLIACLGALGQAYLGHRVTAADLERLRQRFTEAYVAAGYHTSGVLLPDQEVADGGVVFQAVEGRVSEIEVDFFEDAPGQLDRRYVSRRLARGTAVPLRMADLQERVLHLYQDPAIEKIAVEVRPGDKLGEALVRARVKDAKPFSLTVVSGNGQSPSLGEWRGQMIGHARNLFGWGDAFEIRFGRSNGAGDGGFTATIPVSLSDTLLSLRFDRNSAQVIETATRDLQIKNASRTVEIGLSQPVHRAVNRLATVSVLLSRRRSETSLLGEPFSFTPGVVDGRADISVVRLTQGFQWWSERDVVQAQFTLSFGLDILGATRAAEPTNTRFTSWFGQANYVRRLAGSHQLALRTEAQLADGPLYPMEQYSIGGMNTVRGYREGTVVRDAGATGSVEARAHLFDLPLGFPAARGEDEPGSLYLVSFADIGRGWNRQSRSGSTDAATLASAGVGFRWNAAQWLDAQGYYGHALVRRRTSSSSLQDRGIHVRLTSRWTF